MTFLRLLALAFIGIFGVAVVFGPPDLLWQAMIGLALLGLQGLAALLSRLLSRRSREPGADRESQGGGAP